MQIINILDGATNKKGWRNHPAVLMWNGHSDALKLYCNTMIREWIERGYNNNMKIYDVKHAPLPSWFGDKKFHASHRSNLLRKDAEYYGKFGWCESDDLEYIWPVRNK